MSTRILLSFGAVILMYSCGGSTLSHTVDKKRLKDMSREGQVWIYDAENEIVVAHDRLDEAQDELRKLERKYDVSEKGMNAAKNLKHPLAVEVAQAWQDHLKSMGIWAEAKIELCKLGVIVARATVELAEAQVVQKEDLLGGKDFSIKTFRDQYVKLKDNFELMKKQVEKLRQIARDNEMKWRMLRRRYTKATGDHNSGLWTK
ncbi:MAG: hypothetical protein V1754_02160 [Pseudomonadota bacterium]